MKEEGWRERQEQRQVEKQKGREVLKLDRRERNDEESYTCSMYSYKNFIDK